MAIGNSKKQVLLIDKDYTSTLNPLETQASIPMTNITDVEVSTNGEDINVICASKGAKRSYMDEYHSTITLNVETLLTGVIDTFDNVGTDNVVSNLDSMFKLCNLKGTSDATSVTYTPNSDADTSSISIDFYKENVLRNLTGLQGSFTISGTVGQPLSATFNIQGYGSLVPDDNAATIPENSACKMEEIAVIKAISGVTVDGGTINMSSFTLNQNAEIQDTYAVGVAGFNNTDFDATLELTALRVKNDTTHWAAYQAESLQEIIISVITSTGKQITITVPSAKITGLTDGDDAGNQTVVRTYRCQNVLGDDNFSIKIEQL